MNSRVTRHRLSYQKLIDLGKSDTDFSDTDFLPYFFFTSAQVNTIESARLH